MRRRITLVVQVAVLALVLAAPGWGNVGFDGGRSANSPSETSITPDAARNLKVRWHTNLGRSGPPPVASGGRVFALANVADGSELRAYNGANGGCGSGTCTPIWSNRQPVLTTLLYAGGRVRSGGATYVSWAQDPHAYGWRYYGGSYEPATGARTPGGAIDEQLPVAADGCMYGYADNVVYMGTPYPYLSTSFVRRGIDGSCTDADVKEAVGMSTFAVSGHRSYMVSGREVEVSDETPGQCRFGGAPCDGNLWDAHLTAPAAVDDLPVVARGRLFVPTLDGTINVFPTSGCGQSQCAPAYRFRAGAVHIGSLAVTDTRVFAASDDGRLYAFRPAGCGAALCDATWTADLGTPLHSPSVAGDVVYVPSDDGRVFAVDARGCGAKVCTALGSVATGARIRWAPVISAGRVYVLNDAGDLDALGGG
jgi:outer membrane protein assembly factor BamB